MAFDHAHAGVVGQTHAAHLAGLLLVAAAVGRCRHGPAARCADQRLHMQRLAAARGFEARLGNVAGQRFGRVLQTLTLVAQAQAGQGQAGQDGQHRQGDGHLQQREAGAAFHRFQHFAEGPACGKPSETSSVSVGQSRSCSCTPRAVAVARKESGPVLATLTA